MRTPPLLTILVCSAVLASCSQAPSTPHPPVVIHLGGADSMQLIAQDLATAYQRGHPYAIVEVSGGNSATGLAQFARGSLDMALVSRNPLANELKQPPSRAVEIARDGIVFVVHPSNPVTGVSRDQLAKIFSGEVLNWSELTGKPSSSGDDSIQVLSREAGSGTRSVFEQLIMAGRRVTLTALVQPNSRDVLSYVAANPNAIGYAAFNNWKGNLKTRALSIDGTDPTLASIQSSAYPLMQTYYLVLPVHSSQDITDFLDFILSAPGQSLISARMAAVR